MSEFLGEERIRIVPDASGFRAELQAQVAAALQPVQAQIAASQSRLVRTPTSVATPAVAAATAQMQRFIVTAGQGERIIVDTLAEARQLAAQSGGVFEPLAKSAAAAQAATLPLASTTARAAASQTRLAQATTVASARQAALASTSGRVSKATQDFAKNVQKAETAAGRYTRGLFAATAASSGLFRAVSFASGAFLVGALAGGAIASAVSEFKQMTVVAAQTTAVIRATGGAANVTAAQVDNLAKRQLELTGTDDELIKRAANVLLTFRGIRNQAGAMNDVFTRSVKAVQDISSVFGTDLVGSAVQLGKALQDPIRGVTALRRSGITLSQGQRDLIKRLVETGRTLTAQKIILAEVEDQVGGTAEAIGRTLPGRLAILRESASNALGDYVKRISESRRSTELFNSLARELRETFQSLRAVVVGVVQPLASATQSFVGFTNAVGALRSIGGLSTLILVGAAFKATTVSIGLATRAQAAFAGSTIAATFAANAEAAALVRLSAGANLASARLAGTAAGIGAIFRGLSTSTLLGLAAGAVTLTFLQMRKAAKDSVDPIDAATKALDRLGGAIRRIESLRGERAAAAENVSIARADQFAAQRGVGAVQRAIGRSQAQPGSLEQRALEDQLVGARSRLTESTNKLADAVAHLREVDERLRRARVDQIGDIARGSAELQNRIRLIREEARSSQAGQRRLPGVGGVPVLSVFTKAVDLLGLGDSGQEKIKNGVDKALAQFNRLSKSAAPQLARTGAALSSFTESFNKIPTDKQVTIALRLGTQGRGVNEIVAALQKADAATRQLFTLPGTQRGLLSPGNLDLLHRKIARLGDEIATVKTISIGTDKGETLIPTVIEGRIVSVTEAIEHFRKTGENLGTFQNARDADRYAQALHRQQAEFYGAARGARTLAEATRAFAGREEQQRLRGLPPGGGAENVNLQEQFRGAQALVRADKRRLDVISEIVAKRRDELASIRETVHADQEAVQSARDARENAIQGLADARRGLADALRGLADARRALADAHRNLIDVIASSNQSIADSIRNSREAVNEAVQSAKNNLTSLGDSVAQTLTRFFSAVGEGGGLTGKLGPQFQRLRDQILAGGAGAGTQGRAQRLASEIASQQKPVVDTEKIQRQFDDLTDALNRGKITVPEFNKRLDRLLRGVDFNKVQKLLGTAAANSLRDQLRDLRRQAALIVQSPQRQLVRELVNPLRAVADGAKQIATARLQAAKDVQQARSGIQQARRGIQDASRGIQDAGRGVQTAVKGLQRANQDIADAQAKLQRDQAKEAKANRAALAANTKQLKRRNDLEEAKNKLTTAQKAKDKPKGAAGTTADTLVGAQATSP